MAIKDVLTRVPGFTTADNFVGAKHGQLLGALGNAAKGSGILAKGAGLLGKVAKFLGPWGTAISAATLAWNVGKTVFGGRTHPAAQRV